MTDTVHALAAQTTDEALEKRLAAARADLEASGFTVLAPEQIVTLATHLSDGLVQACERLSEQSQKYTELFGSEGEICARVTVLNI